MQDKTLEQLTDENFGTVIESFIEREADGTDEMEASTFFRLWDEIEKKRAKPTIEVEVNIVEGKLVLSLEKPALNVSVRENEIVTPYERIIVRKAFF
ncbi:hypothetical protein FJZ31_31525 [Candidatus Poribacteria bacterium]|nr:hypothetical protein [Candidatus Poribacteria bacterium]